MLRLKIVQEWSCWDSDKLVRSFQAGTCPSIDEGHLLKYRIRLECRRWNQRYDIAMKRSCPCGKNAKPNPMKYTILLGQIEEPYWNPKSRALHQWMSHVCTMWQMERKLSSMETSCNRSQCYRLQKSRMAHGSKDPGVKRPIAASRDAMLFDMPLGLDHIHHYLGLNAWALHQLTYPTVLVQRQWQVCMWCRQRDSTIRVDIILASRSML